MQHTISNLNMMNITNQTGISYFGNRNPRHLIADLRDIKSHHCNFVVHTYSENDQQFYKDTMAEMVGMTKDMGMQAYLDPWGVGRVFGGETYSSFALRNLETCQVLPDGAIAPAVCFNHPKFRDFMQTWIADAAEIGADVLFWDEPHFFIDLKQKAKYQVWYCRCSSCDGKFKREHGGHIFNASPAEIIRFREDCVVSFLAELCDSTQAAGMRNAVCMLPFKDAALGLADWSRVVAIPTLDVFGTDPYWMFFGKDVKDFVGSFSRDVVALCRKFNKEPQIWLQAYLIEAGREFELTQAAAVAYSAGVRNFAAWSYYGNAYMSYNRSEDPGKVWEVIGEIYGRLSQGEAPCPSP